MRTILRRVRQAGESGFRSLARGVLRGLLALRLRRWREEDLGQPAVVFAPHQDDEVLGCGGTILRKRRAGAHVTVAFTTDGAASHAHLMAGEEMSRRRQVEAVAACGKLGVAADDVVFLGFPDGQLSKHLDEAARRVGDVLRRQPFAEVFIPHYHDGPPDHLATTQAVLAALKSHDRPVTVYEYPVWLWCHWPWVGLPGGLRERLRNFRKSLGANWRLVRDFCCFVPVGELLEQKRAALAEHKSQVERLIPDPRWSVLADVFEGQFLACSFQQREIFYRHAPSRE
jgi:LmbE family N-acetylglucosaminyl deacetylase